MINKTYPAKVLLLGEYIIIKGAHALAIPFDGFSGRWVSGANLSQIELFRFAAYLKSTLVLGDYLNIPDFQEELQQGLQLYSNIPIGYGLGSSGAVCAAVYDRYKKSAITDTDIEALKKVLATMEGYFHGSSSGIDPLICYLQQPLLFDPDDSKGWSKVKLPSSNETGSWVLFLLNTDHPRETSPLVKQFLKNCDDPVYLQRLQSELMVYTEDAIDVLLSAQWEVLFELFHEISYFQFRYFSAMIPDYLREYWLAGLNKDTYKLKLCGAGGGGFMLGLTNDWVATQDSLKAFNLMVVRKF